MTATVARTRPAASFRLVADVGVPALIRAGGMAVQLAVLAWVNGPNGPSLMDRLTKWDGRFYISIAESGYPDVTLAGPTGGLTRGGEYAFYPLYSGLVALVHAAASAAYGHRRSHRVRAWPEWRRRAASTSSLSS